MANYAKVEQKLGPMKKLGTTIQSGLKLIRGIQAIKGLVDTILGVFSMVQSVESAMKNEGFVFTQQVANTARLAGQVAALIKRYRDGDYHNSLSRMIDSAKEIDRMDPDALFGSDELSDFCAKIRSDVSMHRDECQEVLDGMKQIHQQSTAGSNIVNTIFNDDVLAMAALR
jgi:hypothetical protein